MIWDKNKILASGIKGDWVLGLHDFVRYSDLDTYDHVNNKIYHTWFENLRIIYLIKSGFDFTNKKNARTMTEKMVVKKYDPVVRKHVEYKEGKIK